MKVTHIISHKPMCLFAIQKMSLYLIVNQVSTILREPIFEAFNRMYSIICQIDGNRHVQNGMGGCQSLGQNAQRPLAFKIVAAVKSQGGSIRVY
jgi:hypothetical protein